MREVLNLLEALLDQARTANWLFSACVILGSYCIGCFATGYYLVRYLAGQDPRSIGSGGVGAKNIGRILGWRGFVITLGGDMGKGALALWAARHFTSDPQALAIAMVSVIAGHIWPFQLRFRGGKGFATFFGALAVYDFRLVVAFLLLFAGIFPFVRRTVLPGLFAVALLPAVGLCISAEPMSMGGAAEVLRLFCAVGIVLVAHRRNIAEEINLLLERRHLQSKNKV